MSQKTFCDACGGEINEDDMEQQYPNVFYQVRITKRVGQVHNYFDLCIPCQTRLQRTVEQLIEGRGQ